MVELTRHTHIILAVSLEEFCSEWHFVISAPSGGQILQLIMSLVGVVVGGVHIRAAVIEYGRVGGVFVNHSRQPLHHFYTLDFRVFPNVLELGGIESHRLHARLARLAYAGVARKADIVEYTVGNVEALAYLTGICLQIILIVSNGAQVQPAAFGYRRVGIAWRDSSARVQRLRRTEVDIMPFGMLVRILLAPAYRYVYRSLCARRVDGFDLLLQQVEIKPRVHLTELGGEIRVSVVALGEHGYQIHLRVLQSLGEFLLAKVLSDIGDGGTRVKIEVNAFHNQLLLYNINLRIDFFTVL